ncbi:hypothetical protein BJ684DRAFT_20364 [Piptocephalis cylindrospora]|uniref:Uncharacterized protein n=1 Tax=Piptocephalis cylindrospora TaxID=1907219 RepID=A0A4P9Y5Q1_9FUNG|nr:hypothetical protein BJ684DRAFT_20364 [Piptocephalis cylindrospora]|eukprot:RKP13130.1 hypothetical protein BJ684DRAFT_20364 [Piptocephalis cylindrospora]
MPKDNMLVRRLLLGSFAYVFLLLLLLLLGPTPSVDAKDTTYGVDPPSPPPPGKRECGWYGLLDDQAECPPDCAQITDMTQCQRMQFGSKRCVYYDSSCHRDINCKVQKDGLCPKGCHPGGLYGCLPNNEQFPKTCEKHYSQPSCEKAHTVNGAKCGWDLQYNRCTFIQHAPIAMTQDQLVSKLEAQRKAKAAAAATAAAAASGTPSSETDQRIRTASDDNRIRAQELAATDPNAVFNSKSPSSPSSGATSNGRRGDALTAQVAQGGSGSHPVATSQNGGGGGGESGSGSGGTDFQLNNGNGPSTVAFGNPGGGDGAGGGSNGPKDADLTTSNLGSSNTKVAAIIGSCIGALALAGFALLAIHQYKVRSAQRSLQMGAAEANSSSLLSNIRRAINPSRP